MKVDDFLVELFMDEFEMGVELNIAETCVDPFTLEEFLKLMDKEDFFEEFKIISSSQEEQLVLIS
ncbi:MAG: hypothetical protein ACTSO7_17970 [Candidatus Heimdallarchaeota archaeon]